MRGLSGLGSFATADVVGGATPGVGGGPDVHAAAPLRGGAHVALVGRATRAAATWAALQLVDGDARSWRTGLLGDVAKRVLEAALEAELEAHLGYSKHEHAGRRRGSNSRNGTRRKTVRTSAGVLAIDVPRDRWGTFEPVTVGKWQRRATGLDQLVVPLAASGALTGEMVELLSWVYRDTLDRRVLLRMAGLLQTRLEPWHARALAPVQPVVLLDRVVVRSRSLALAAPPVHTAVGVAADGRRELLGLWRGGPSSGPDQWHGVAAALRSRGVLEVDAVVVDPLPGIGAAVGQVWRQAMVHERPARTARGTAA